MSFMSGIVSGITGAFKVVSGIIGGVSSAVGSVIDASGIASLLAVVTQLTNSIGSVVGGVTDALGGIIDPIKNVVQSVETLADSIETNIIAPIVRPIVDTVNKVHDLTKSIDRLVDQGITGIIEIPRALANSLTSIERQWAASTAALAAANKIIVTDELIPGIQRAVAPGLDGIVGELGKLAASMKLDVDATQTVAIGGTKAEDFLLPLSKEFAEAINNPTSFPGILAWVLTNTFNYFVSISAVMAGKIDDAIDVAHAADPRKKLSPAEALDLWRRKIISTPDLDREMAFAGYNAVRQAALKQGMAYLPSPAEAVDWWHRSLISEAERNDIMVKHGFSDGAIDAVVASSNASIPEDTLLTWLAKEFITRDTFERKMKSKGYTVEDMTHVLQDALQDPQVNTAINWHWNVDAARAGWFTSTYASLPPQDVVDAARIARIDPTETMRRWQSQFSAMPVTTAITLFFRGELPRRDVETVVQQNGFPREMTDMLIKAASPVIPSRSIPTLVAKGELSISDGISRLTQRGFTREDADILLAGAKEIAEETATTAPTEETRVTASQARAAYKDGAIDEATLVEILKVIGYNDTDIGFYVALDQYDLALAARKDEIDTIKAQVGLGTLTVDEAIEAFFQLGLLEPEVTRLAVTLKQTKRAAAKTPDLGLLRTLAKNDLINQDEFLAGVQALGYSDGWDLAIQALQYGGYEDDGGTPET
jgi:hypothetical protein